MAGVFGVVAHPLGPATTLDYPKNPRTDQSARQFEHDHNFSELVWVVIHFSDCGGEAFLAAGEVIFAVPVPAEPGLIA